ncbi:MAG: LD-carboxypeptidase [Paludibacter sp.]|nr:LD-carboxypeptidase [Paludibacter sp.]
MIPPYLQSSDQIRIVSPSGSINPEFIDGANKTLVSWGLHVTEGEFARLAYGRFAGTKEQRISDFQNALNDPNVKAILCSRGGYGIAQIIDKIDFTEFLKSPKWLIGFSDITILHNAITKLGVASIHGIMAKHLAESPAVSEQVLRLKDILFGQLPTYKIQPHLMNRHGKAEGNLIGGNLSVLMGLRGSQFDLDYKNSILFIEDIAEKPYHIDRMIQNLRFSGVLSELSGLVVGQFADCEEDSLMMQTIAEIIYDAVKDYNYPLCFNFPAGHVNFNLPLVLGANVNLQITNEGTSLYY